MDGVAAVVPTHRRPEKLLRALGSIAAQSQAPDQIVVVDVGAGSWDVAGADHFARDSGIPTEWLPVETGVFAGAARNLGASAATSHGATWVAFLDDDDTWDTSYLEAALSLAGPATDLVATRIRLRHGTQSTPLPPIPSALAAHDVLARNPGVTGSSVIIRAATFADLGGYDGDLAAFNDLDFLIRALDAAVTIATNQEPLVEQWIEPGLHATSASWARLAALDRFMQRYASRMTSGQRRTMRRDRHRILKHISNTRAARWGHLFADVTLTSPAELRDRAVRRRRLRGGYD